jgi:hypothetical protein
MDRFTVGIGLSGFKIDRFIANRTMDFGLRGMRH